MGTNSTMVGNITFISDLEPTVMAKTASVMNKGAKTCSVEECAKEHLELLASMLGLNLLFLIIVILICICTKRNCCNKSSRKEIEATQITTLERTTADQSGEQSPTAITPVAAPPRKPLPLPPTLFQQTSSTDTEHPTYLEIISDGSLDFQEQSLGNNLPERTRSKRALIPPSRHRQPTTSQPSTSMNNMTDDYEIASYLEPQEGLRIQNNAGEYAELRFQGRESRADSATKSKGYLGLNSLTRIRAKMKRNRTDR